MKNIANCVSSDKSNKAGFEIDHIETTYNDGLQPNDKSTNTFYKCKFYRFSPTMGLINNNNSSSRDISTLLYIGA